MALPPTAIKEVESGIERISREIWNLPASFPKAGLHALLDKVGLNIPLVWEDYCGAASIRSWTQILNDEGALGTTTRASIRRASNMFRHWPLELAFHSRRKGRTPICTSGMARHIATLLTADLHPTDGPEIWSGYRISSSITSKISFQTDSDGCPLDNQPFPPPLFLLHKLTPLWEHGDRPQLVSNSRSNPRC
jgi:hypothetical protein